MAAESAPLRAAIVGPGYIGAVHIEALRRIGAEVALLVGRPGSDLASRAATLGVARYSHDLEAALGDPRIDVVHICTPNGLHYLMARAVLEHSKHLVCEKPLTTTLDEARALVQLADAADVVAGIAYCYRFYPLVSQARHLIATGGLGRIHHVRGLYLADELLHDAYLHYRFDPQMAGRSVAMADVGVHWCDLAEYVTGQRIMEVLADMQTVAPRRVWRRGASGAGPPPPDTPPGEQAHTVEVAGEECLSLLVRFDGGARGAVTVSQASAGHKNHIALSIDGADGGLDWNQEQPNVLTVRRRAASEVVVKDPLLLAPEAAALARFPGGHPEGYPDAFQNLMARMYDAIARVRLGKVPGKEYPSVADGCRGVALVEAALRSAQERRWIALA